VPFGGTARQWVVLVADLSGKGYVVLDRFNNNRGAASWRRSHPHPVFSPDGRRIYYNVSADKWTRLCVAERVGP
jgi:Tol biopolymer transport system component